MAQPKPKKIRYTTPAGTFKFPKLTAPDFGTDKYPKKDGEYNVRLILDGNDPATKALLDKLQPELEAAEASANEKFAEMPIKTRAKFPNGVTVNPLYDTVYDEDENPTGEVELRFKMRASGTRKDGKRWTSKPAVWDSKGNKWDPSVDIWGGTVGRIIFTADPYFVEGQAAAGVTLRLSEAQVISLVSKGAAQCGFDEVEGGADIHDYVDDSEETFGGSNVSDDDGADEGNF